MRRLVRRLSIGKKMPMKGLDLVIAYREVKLGNLWEFWERNQRKLENGVEETVYVVNDCKQVRTATAFHNDREEEKMAVTVSAAAPGILGVIVVARSSNCDSRGNCGHYRGDLWIIKCK